MAPEPDSKPVTIRLALARVEAGEDLGLVLSELYDSAARAGRAVERRLRDPFAQDEPTPVTTARERLHPSQRPTAPPAPPPPLGALGPAERTPTSRGTPVPPAWRKR